MLVRKIYLSWRKGKGHKRHIIGIIKRSMTETPVFNYITKNIEKAQADGFKDYPGFAELQKVYTENVIEAFSLRLIPKERADRKTYLSFWEADKKDYDDFDLLALTQGWSPTDNFEFLAQYFPKKGFSFVTDIANLTKENLPRDFVNIDEKLKFEIEHNNLHGYDNKAIKVLKMTGEEVGYIKQIHCRPFFKTSLSPIITVKTIDQNGVIKQIFISVKF